MKRKLSVLVGACILGLIAPLTGEEGNGAGSIERPPNAEPKFEGSLKAGDKAPDFTLKDMDGKEVVLSSFRGKPVFLIFGSYT